MSAPMKAPERIWLQWMGDKFGPAWCLERASERDVEYVAVDRAQPEPTEQAHE